MNVRLLDVLIFGPSQMLISHYVINNVLKYFIFLTGVLSILFNGHNYLYLNMRVLKKPILFFVNKKNGKTQIHRLFNLFVTYPVFWYIYKVTIMPKWLSGILLVNIIGGFIFNLNNFIKINAN